MDSSTDSNSTPSLSPLQPQILSDSDGDTELKSLSPEPLTPRHQILPLFLPKPYTKPTLMRVKSVQAPESPTTTKSPTFDEVPTMQIQIQANVNGHPPNPLEMSQPPITVLKPQMQRSKSNPPIPPKPDMSKFREKAMR